RQRLVPLIDDLLVQLRHDDDLTFLLDGQAIVLEDYLDVRPEMTDAVRRMLAAGRIEAGPWYVLADELIPPGELLIRNLLAGRRVLRRLGAKVVRVLYSPDSFGHPEKLPALAEGFGFPVAVVWRGFGGEGHPEDCCVEWKGRDGS